jgi:hypothetical protein
MSTRTLTLWDHSCRALRFLNYEVHLIQHGMARFAGNHPWVGVPLATICLVLVWSVYWAVYPVLVVVTILASIVRLLKRS